MSRAVFITYEEAQRLKPVFRQLVKEAPWKEARESAARILEELSFVRKDVDYSDLGGKQLLLQPTDYSFLMDVMDQTEIR